VRDWWLRDVPSSYDVALPQHVFMRWFKADPKVDEYCRWVKGYVNSGVLISLANRESFGGAVEHARSLNTGQIEEMVTGPEEAVGAIILLDQMPRNIFRGEAAKTVSPPLLKLESMSTSRADSGL
jgi:uncharacterized protein (DUF924 family)